MTFPSLQRLREMAESATPGPWTTDYDKDGCCVDREGEQLAVTNDREFFSADPVSVQCKDNAAFIAASRTAFPAILSALEEAIKGLENIANGDTSEMDGTGDAWLPKQAQYEKIAQHAIASISALLEAQ